MSKSKKTIDPNRCGWIPNSAAVDEILSAFAQPVFGVAASRSGIAGSGHGKRVLLHKALEGVLGAIPTHFQTAPDCTSHAAGLGVDIVKAVRIVNRQEPEKFIAETATETIYGYSRNEVAGGQLGNRGGSTGAWTMAALKRGGTLARLRYTGGPRQVLDLRKYSGQRAKTMGRPGQGVPDWIEPVSQEHPIQTASLIRDFEEAADSIANGYPVIVCSSIAYGYTRDKHGFSPYNPNEEWLHAMMFPGMNFKGKNPGLLCFNSWGEDWIDGPKQSDQPDGTFWVTPKDANRMFAEQDSWAISGYTGYPAQESLGDRLMLI